MKRMLIGGIKLSIRLHYTDIKARENCEHNRVLKAVFSVRVENVYFDTPPCGEGTILTMFQEHEITRRKSLWECLRCAWPSDRKWAHRVKDCICPIKLDKGTASFPNGKAFLKLEPSETQTQATSSSEENASSGTSSSGEDASSSEEYDLWP